MALWCFFPLGVGFANRRSCRLFPLRQRSVHNWADISAKLANGLRQLPSSPRRHVMSADKFVLKDKYIESRCMIGVTPERPTLIFKDFLRTKSWGVRKSRRARRASVHSFPFPW